MKTLISLAGGLASALFTVFFMHYLDPGTTVAGWIGFMVGDAITAGLLVLYVVTVNVTTADKKLQEAK